MDAEAEERMRLAVAVAVAALGPVWDRVRVGASLVVEHDGAWVTLSTHPAAPPDVLAGLVAAQPLALFDDRPVPGEDPEPTPTRPPRGISIKVWRVFLTVVVMKRDKPPPGKKLRVKPLGIAERASKLFGHKQAPEYNTVRHAVIELRDRGYLRSDGHGGYDLGDRAPKDCAFWQLAQSSTPPAA